MQSSHFQAGGIVVMVLAGTAGQVKRLIRSRHFWLILTVLTALSLFHYIEQLGIAGEVPGYHFGLVRHSIDRILFLVPIFYAGFVFGSAVGWATCFVAYLIMLPRALFISPNLLDDLLESTGILILGVVTCFLFEVRRKMEQQRRETTAELDAMAQDLQSHIRLSRSNEKRLATLNAISGLLGRSLDLDSVLRGALDMTMEVMEVEVALIFSLDEEAQELQLIAYEGVSEKFAQNVNHLKVGEGFNGRVVITGEPEIIVNASTDPGLSRPMVSQEKIEAQLIVPLRSRGRIVGTLCVGNRRPRQFLPEEVELLTIIGSQVGITVENARLFREQRLIAEQYQSIFENSSDAIWVQDLEGNIITANKATEKLTGFTRKKLAQLNVRGFLSPEALDVAREVRRKLLEGKTLGGPYEQRIMKQDGTEAVLKLTTSLVLKDGQSVGFQHVARDVTEEKSLAEMLAKITNGSPVATFVINREHKVTHWNTVLESLSGISSQEVLGTDGQWQAFYPEKRPTMADLIVDGASLEKIEVYYQGKYRPSSLIEGAYEAVDFFPTLTESGRWLRFTASPIKNANGEIIAAIETLQDITEEKQLQENMRFHIQLITKAQEEERKRLARELHDETTQRLVAVSHDLERLVSNNKQLSVDDNRLLTDLREDVRTALQEVRHFTRDLRPPILDDLGLLPALEWLASDLREQYGIKTSLRVIGNQRRLDPEAELLLFRIAQEALNNVRRHAAASKVELIIGFDEGKTRLTVKDDGKGFQMPATIGEFSRSGKLGLTGIEERTRLLGGSMRVQSEPGKGTTLTVEAPL